jgi:hypothetical protein
VAKVKKRARVTGVRNVKKKAKTPVRTARKKAKAAMVPASTTRTRDKAPKRSAARSAAVGGRKVRQGMTKKGRPAPPPPVVRVAVRELDPQRKCGAGTSVQFLYRVDETVDGRATAHLVFFDRHGWYCEHGRTCPAVGHARKYNGQLARVS